MAGEVFVLNDGSLSWCVASGISGGFTTASAPASAISMEFVEGVSLTSGQRNYSPIRDRGSIKQVVYMNDDLTTVEFSRLYTGGDGLPTGYIHLEFKQEIEGLNSAWWQFTHARKTTMTLAEQEEGDMITESFVVTSILNTGSGLLV